MAKSKRGKHTSVRGVFKHSVVWLESLAGVKKVILGPHNPCHHSMAPGTLVFSRNIETGIKIRGYTDGGVRDIFLVLDFSDCRDGIRDLLERKFHT